MHTEHSFFPREPMLPFGDQGHYHMENAPMESFFNEFVPPGIKPRMPFCSGTVDIRPSDACPRNFVIFDQTNNRSQITFHPEINPYLIYPGFGVDASIFQSNVDQCHANDERKIASSFKEDSDDINALLSTEYEENEDCNGGGDDDDDDEVSTARTGATYGRNSPDSCSNYESPSSKSRSLFKKSSGSRCNGKQHQRTRKMMKALRGIVPGANRMSTVAVLDEAVRYLKSLRVEVQKLGGVRNSEV